MTTIDFQTSAHILRALAKKYERAEFLRSDPSQFMHRYSDHILQERVAFIASALSYGNRTQFIPKIDTLLHTYLAQKTTLPDNDDCFYRLHTNRMINTFLAVLETIYLEYGSMKEWMKANKINSGIGAIKLITRYFSEHNASNLVPKNEHSTCKRLCMFLRWMVRDSSPVDLGLWSDLIDKKTLIIPMDTHVLQEARKLDLINTQSATMATAKRLTELLKEIFPDDPLRGDFALFGLGVEQ